MTAEEREKLEIIQSILDDLKAIVRADNNTTANRQKGSTAK